MRIIIANIIGILAVIMFVLSYQFKTRKKIIFFNGGSRVLYVLQYLLLFAFEGAVMDVVALIVTAFAHQRDNKFFSKHKSLLIIGSNLFVVAIGLMFYKNLLNYRQIMLNPQH